MVVVELWGGDDREEWICTYFRDTLLVRASIQHRPCYPARVLALKKQGLGFAVLEAEDLAIAADVEFSLPDHHQMSAFLRCSSPVIFLSSHAVPH